MKYEFKIFIIHIISCVVLSLLSLIGLAFNDWELSMCTSISSIFAFVYFVLLIKGSEMVTPEVSGGKTGLFLLFTFLRFLIALVGILIPALIIWLTNGDGEKLRFLNLLGATLPFVMVNVILICVKKKD